MVMEFDTDIEDDCCDSGDPVTLNLTLALS